MIHHNHQILRVSLLLYVTVVTAAPPEFRILSPEFVCPKDEQAAQVKPDNTVISLSTKAGIKLDTRWTVRWTPLPAPAQRSTLLLWKAVRDLEKKLNGPQKEPYVYVIQNDEILPGVNYIFNVTAINAGGEETTKSFNIDNVLGNQKLEHIEGRADMLSILLVGGQETYADVDFTLDALVTTCFPTQDYYFEWTVQSMDTDDKVDISSTSAHLEIPAFSLKAGLTYYASCQVLRHSNGDFITQNGLPFIVLERTFEVYLNVDHLTVPANAVFSIESVVLNHDYYGENLTYFWECTYRNNSCEDFESVDNRILYFENGLSSSGKYEVALTVSVRDHSRAAGAVITVLEHNSILPVIQVSPLPRVLNEGTRVTLVANASDVTPSCTLTWYFASEQYLLSLSELNDPCADCQHGEPLMETLTVNSLEENFLNEITDFTNETEWKQMTGLMEAAAGRARFLVHCGAPSDAQTVHADVTFKLNVVMKPKNVMVAPDSGTALVTIFRISTLAVVDLNPPLYYSFFCRAGPNTTLLLGSYAEHLSVETFLPYTGEEGTEIWVKVCDVLGACSESATKVVTLSPGHGNTVGTLLNDVRAHIRRCEWTLLQKTSVAVVVTYRNAGLPEALSEYCTKLLNALAEGQHCLKTQSDHYDAFSMKLTEAGCDATHLIDNY